MTTSEEIIKKQGEQIDALKKAVTVLVSRLNRLEQRERSASAHINNNSRDIRAIASSLDKMRQRGG